MENRFYSDKCGILNLLTTLTWLVLVIGTISSHVYASGVDDALGMAIVDLSTGREASAILRLRDSHSQNAKALLERLKKSAGPFQFTFDYEDPTFLGFYDYVKHLSSNSNYSFFHEILLEVDARNPNKELGTLGGLLEACFSSKSKHLLIHSTQMSVVLETRTANTIFFTKLDDRIIDQVEFYFSQDEERLLIIMPVNPDSIKNSLTTQYSIVDTQTPRTELHWNTTKSRQDVFADTKVVSILGEAKEPSSTCISYSKSGATPSMLSPDRKYRFMGDYGSGIFLLAKNRNGEVIRKFWFASDIE